MKCDNCENEAAIHITEIRRGLPADRHLCERCADMFLPLEESDYADYLDILPPLHTTVLSEGPPPTERELAMTGISQRVCVVDAASGEVRPTAPPRGDSFSPVWSPDSKRLAMCHSFETLQSVVVTAPGETWMRRFLRTTFAEPPSWSADGRLLVFSHPEDGRRVILAAEVAGERVHNLSTTPSLDEFMPVWSPVNDRIAFASRPIEGRPVERASCSVYVTTPDAKERLRLVTVQSAQVTRLGWSADARFLAALAMPAAEDEPEEFFGPPEGTLHVMPADSLDAGRTAVAGKYLSFAWSRFHRDGPRKPPMLIAAEMTGEEPTVSAKLVQPETRETRTLAEGVVFPAAEALPEHLSPDGRTLIAVAGPLGGRIICVDVETGAMSRIETEGEVTWLGWHPAGEEIGVLVRVDAGVRMEMLTRAGRRRRVITFRREDCFDVPGMAFSPDGRFAAVETHVARTA